MDARGAIPKEMIDPSQFVPTIEVRTRFSPPVRVSTSHVRGGGPGFLLKALAPTVVGMDANDQPLFQLAPYGVAGSRSGTVVFVALVVGVLAVAFMAGRAST